MFDQQAHMELSRQALADSQQMDVGRAPTGDLCRIIGRLEVALEVSLMLLDEKLAGGA
ncbi:hypothetical protein ACFWJT_15715 [Streptomyces sp. NPDC127069]|uniref:hypothetical protein n=1 Tax=Streptomyces sp. NPDC127069 TaxID=3347128 RepID=UPI003648B32F